MATSMLEKLEDAFVKTPPLLRTPKTIQILLIRETHDYSIFRTEETRELNTVVLPLSSVEPKQTPRVAFLASKQKAPETRNFASAFKEYLGKFQLADEKDDADILACELKDHLCRRCPRCILFGAVTTEKGEAGGSGRWNIKHRIEYSTAYSLEPYELVADSIVFNAVTDSTQSTGQALGSTENVTPVVKFPSVISLNSVTKEEFLFFMKTLLATKSYGAEGRTKGDTVNYVTGILAGNEEMITSLEYALELSAVYTHELSTALTPGLPDVYKATWEITQKYASLATFGDAVVTFEPQALESLVDEVQMYPMTSEFIGKMHKDAVGFHSKLSGEASGESPSKKGRKEK